jgi:diguanylate cyclase (GGDEF)-like protein
MLVAVDNLGRINEAYGFDAADEVVAEIARRIRRQMRGKDHLARFSGTKFGIILNNCTPEDMLTAADRLLAGVRDEVVQTAAGRRVTVTIGGGPGRAMPAPRDALSRAGRARQRRSSAAARSAYWPNLEREAQRGRTSARRGDHRRARAGASRWYEPIVAAASRRPAFYEC